MKAYYGSRISENMTKTPEGFLICHNVPIARTGVQQYMRSELGIEDGNGFELIDVIRSDEDVFADATLASFEGKPVTDEHPPDDLTPENIAAFENGHVQNVRRGVGEESDLIIADLFITNPRLIDAVERKDRREVSCGYTCNYEEIDGKLYQRAIRGNHVAVVPAGRAGSRVAIKDSATEPTIPERSKKPMSNKKIPLIIRLLSRQAKDMEPDEIADNMMEVMNAAGDEEPANTPDATPATPAPAAAPAATDEGGISLEGLASAIAALTAKVDALAAAKDETPAAEVPADEDPLEKLADELLKASEETPADEEAAATIPADEMPTENQDEDGPVAASELLPENPIPGADRAIAALTAIRPVIAGLPKEQRKAASDKAVAEIRKLMGKDAKPKTNGYNAVSQIIRTATKGKAQDSAAKSAQAEKLGQTIMANRNPHYKK